MTKEIILKKLSLNKAYILFSFVFSFFLICSYLFYYKEGITTLTYLVVTIILSGVIAIPIFGGLVALDKILSNVKWNINEENTIGRQYGIYVVILFCMHLCSFFVLYPGLYIYDVGGQIGQYDSGYFNKHHPLIHTILLGKAKYLFSDVNSGFAVFTLFQMVLVELAMAYAIYTIYKKTNMKWLRTILLLFYGLFPINNLMTISITKDVLFSASALVFVIDSYKLFSDRLQGKWAVFRYLCCGIFMLLLRNNAIYAYIPYMLIGVGWHIFNKKKIIKVAGILVLILLGFVVFDKGITNTLQASKGSVAEMFSVPAQEMAVIYRNTDDEETIKIIEKYIQDSDIYITYLSDPMKGQLPFYTIDDTCKEFILDAVKLNFKHPLECLNAILYQTQGFWDIFHNPYSEYHYFLMKTDYRGGANLDSKLPTLLGMYEKMFRTSKGCLFMNHSIYIWMLVWALIRSFYAKNRTMILTGVYPFFYFLTLLLSPGAILRYAWIYVLLLPLIIPFIVRKTEVEEKIC